MFGLLFLVSCMHTKTSQDGLQTQAKQQICIHSWVPRNCGVDGFPVCLCSSQALQQTCSCPPDRPTLTPAMAFSTFWLASASAPSPLSLTAA